MNKDPPPIPIAERSLHNFKVLILDDDPDVCLFISTVLTEIGVNFQSINNPTLLFKTLEEFKPHLLLLDILLPGYNGFELLNKLRKDLTYKDLMIVVITAQQSTDTLLEAYADDADELLYKPLGKEEIEKCINLFFSKQLNATPSSDQNRQGGLGSSEASFSNATIILIDPNKQLLKILKTAFESHHLQVKTFHEGIQVLTELENWKKGELPALIISERILPDVDGVELLKQLNSKFKPTIPFYFLTEVEPESEGAKHGALEYFKKPFNLPLLIQKALKAISDKHLSQTHR